MSDETGFVWIEMDSGETRCSLVSWWLMQTDSSRPDLSIVLACAQCHEWISYAVPHLDLFREFETYRDDPHYPSWIVCSEGCAISLIQERGYTVIANPGVVTA